MEKKISIFLVVVLSFMFFSLGIAYTGEAEKKSQAIFTFPLSILEIEDEAFEGTAVETVILPKGFFRIGDAAFAGAEHLRDAFIPDTTEYIADTSFDGVSKFNIHGIEGSQAEDWANEHKIPFIVDDIWGAVLPFEASPGYQNNPDDRYFITILLILFIVIRNEYYGYRSRRPQDCPELNPIDYRFP